MATNKNITMKQFNGVDYDTLYPKTIAAQIDDVYSKDEMSNLFLPKAGGSMGGILDMNGNRITNLPTPTSNSEPATKEYVDARENNQIIQYTGNGLDERTIELSGSAKMIIISRNEGSEAGLYSIRGMTTLAYFSGGSSRDYNIYCIFGDNNVRIGSGYDNPIIYYNGNGVQYFCFAIF